MYFFEKL